MKLHTFLLSLILAWGWFLLTDFPNIFFFPTASIFPSFSPLRVQLFHDGLIFYTFTPYTVENQTAKRSYISDYFFTSKQTDYFLLVQDYIESLRQMPEDATSGDLPSRCDRGRKGC